MAQSLALAGSTTVSGGENNLRTACLGDIDVSYREAGAGPRLVFLHGLAQDHRMWAAQQQELRDLRTYAYDLRGHGGTNLGDADGSLAQLGGDLIGFLEHIGPATCVGFSLGGTVVLWAAAERPELFEGLGVVATSSVVGRSAAAGLAHRISLFERGEDDEVRAALRADTAAQVTDDAVDVDALTSERMGAIGDRRGYVNGARAMAGMHEQPLNKALSRINRQVLVVGGECDVVCPPRAAEIMLEHLPDAVYVELPGTGHLVTEDDPAALTATLRGWLDGGTA
jgi:3-oxoadipate enol-lactonase